MDKNKAALYIGNAFLESQLLYVIPFLDGYAKEKGVTDLVFEYSLSKKVRLAPGIGAILSSYKLTFLEPHPSNIFSKPYKLLSRMLSLSYDMILLIRNARRANVLNTTSWLECQIIHGLWDGALLSSKDGMERPNLFGIFRSAVSISFSKKRAKKLVSIYAVKHAILGHTVYAGRAILAILRGHGVEIIAQASSVLYRLPKDHDVAPGVMPRGHWEILLGLVKNDDEQQFWSKRVEGISNYHDARLASNGFKKIKAETPRNIVFLHVFRDSPYNHIDLDRIFVDYIEWVSYTLKVIRESREKWLVKFHPNSAAWGESSETWINCFAHLQGQDAEAENVEMDLAQYSNIDLLRNAKRIVTFHGTVHLEAAAFGIRPLVIGETTLGSYDSGYVLKPTSREEYESYLTQPSDSELFKLDSTASSLARRLLLLKEEHLVFNRDVGSLPVYRGDDKKVFEREFISVLEKTSLCQHELQHLGRLMARGLPRSVSFSDLDYWANSFFNRSGKAR